MPHKFYHGKTGRVFNVNPNSIGVIVNKQVRNRIEPKRIHVRVEHVRRSKCEENFKNRIRQVEAEKRQNKEKKNRKRLPVGPRGETRVVVADTSVVFQNPEFHKEIF
jgi:large subunit ribosomal protein L21e